MGVTLRPYGTGILLKLTFLPTLIPYGADNQLGIAIIYVNIGIIEENLLTVYNLHGQLVHRQIMQALGRQQLELGGLNPGQYVLGITSGAQTQRLSIIKQ
jgi:hypothetical protein